jgi:DNA-binding Xre family transcriptional regulator
MTKRVVSKAKQARLCYAARRGTECSLRDVQKETGIAISTLSRLESGVAQGIEFSTLARLCEFYGVEPGDLFEVKDVTEDRDTRYAVHGLLAAA